ncbi:unnamed protein product, partial [Ectocarpus sp. 12 AP-2014]
MTFLGAMLSLLLPRSAWRVIQRRTRTGWRQDQFLQSAEEVVVEDDSASSSRRTDRPHEERGRSRSEAGPPPPTSAAGAQLHAASESPASSGDNGTAAVVDSSSTGRKGQESGAGGHSRTGSGTGRGSGTRIGRRLRRGGEGNGGSRSSSSGGDGSSSVGGAEGGGVSGAGVGPARPPASKRDSSVGRNGGGAAAATAGSGAGEGPESSLDLSLRWEGVVLKDVELRRDFLSELLGLPVDVPHAFVRRAVLHLPWYTLLLGPKAGRQRPMPRWLKWVMRRLKVKLADVTLRYESVGMCPLQGAAPAAVEVTLGSLEVQPVSLQGASAWFKRHVQAEHKSLQFRE